MAPVRGRPGKVNPEKMKEAILKYKDIVKDNTNIVSKTHDVWSAIAKDLKDKVTTNNLYLFTMCNRYNVKDIIFNKMYNNKDVSANESTLSDMSWNESSINVSSDDSIVENFYIISLLREEFANILTEKIYKRQINNKGKTYYRLRKVLQPGKWQEVITDKFWEATHMKCGFQFKNHYISVDAKSGIINGSCKCGSTLKCIIEDTDPSNNCVKLNCTYTRGKGNCKKRYLRNPTRTIIGKELQNKSVHVYRAERAHTLMVEGDSEPPHLYSSAVLQTAKSEATMTEYVDRDALKALVILKSSSLQNIIHNIGLDPVFVHYWSNHQLNVYKKYAIENDACVSIDATGSIIKHLCKADGSVSKHIFLYHCVINCKSGQFSVCQMVSESHNANSIHFWLTEWLRSGAPVPKEVVCDSSRALLIAIIRAFTGYLNIEDYADACKNSNLPKCYVRIDVAHYIKKYANFLKSLNKRVKMFYLGAIGQLILCRNIINAKEIIQSIFIIALSETDGNLKTGNLTQCDEARIKLINLMTSNNEFQTENFETDSNSGTFETENVIETGSFDNPFENSWTTWGKQILNDVRSLITSDEGNRINPLFFPQLVDRLMVDIRLLPLWTNIYTDKFGYGRIPASSTSVESEFNKIKSLLLKNCPLLRIDSFIQKHVNYLHGIMKIANTLNEPTINTDLSDTNNSCPACQNNDQPTDAHICCLCQKHVHALPQCSLPFEDAEEGYGQRRICMMCKNVGNIKNILASREVENWRGLETAKPHKTNALYLGKSKHKLIDSLTCKKAVKIPILKNGNNLSLKSLSINDDNYTITNTCAFDSIFQILLAAGHDSNNIKIYLSKIAETNLFFKLIVNSINNGISLSSYKLRAQILLEIFPISDVGGCKYVNCETNVGYLAGILFKDVPSFEETSRCNSSCPPRYKKLSVIQIDKVKIAEASIANNFNEIIKQSVYLEGEHPCCSKNCSGIETTTLSKTGK